MPLNTTYLNDFCPLCRVETHDEYFQDPRRNYLVCRSCHLVFVPSTQYLSEADEKAAYDHHQNSPMDPDYRRFLSRLCSPLQDRLTPNSQGLDFGSGPGPTLSVMLEEIGHTVTLYDHFYAHNPTALHRPYDFITATEVVEHLHNPATVLWQLWTLLKPGGYLGLMTKLVRDQKAFATWHYKNDLTHVCFFSKSTFEWLADQWQATLEFFHNDVIMFNKPVNSQIAIQQSSLNNY